MVDPATLKVAAKAAVSVLTDEDKRRKVIMIAIAPLAAFILIISLFFYILTMPLRILGDFFFGSDYDTVRNVRVEHGYDQYIYVLIIIAAVIWLLTGGRLYNPPEITPPAVTQTEPAETTPPPIVVPKGEVLPER